MKVWQVNINNRPYAFDNVTEALRFAVYWNVDFDHFHSI
jgi:hypothetical protein